MHVEAAVVTGFDHPVHAAGQQFQVQHALHQHPQRGVGRRIQSRAGLHRGNRRQLRRQHHLVHVALRAAETAIDRKGAGDVSSVAVELAAGIDQ
ncbi:hypothetical protein D3C85_1634140 [compost metagenome]